MPITVFYDNKDFSNHIKYSFETIFRCIGIKEYDFKMSLDEEEKKGIYYGKIVPNNFCGIVLYEGRLFSEDYLSNKSLPDSHPKYFNEVPCLYGKDDEVGIVQCSDYTLITLDIIQMTFFCVTGYEEIVNRCNTNLYDMHGRYKAKERILYKTYSCFKPLVNVLAFMLMDELIYRNMYVGDLKKRASYAHITHDIDMPFGISRYKNCINRIKKKIGLQICYRECEGFDYILNVEKKNAIKSSWYFIGDGNNQGYEFYYDVRSKKIQSIYNKISSMGNEIGMHYSYNAAYEEIQFRVEKEKLEQAFSFEKICGRNHYLRYSIPESWRIYEKNNIFYDATLGSAQQEGFIYGICTPFQLFDAEKGIKLDVWEIPLTIMDGTICTKQYRGLSEREIIDNTKILINEVKKYKGVLSVLWHNSSTKNRVWRKWEPLYENLMSLISKELQCISGVEIIDAYKER